MKVNLIGFEAKRNEFGKRRGVNTPKKKNKRLKQAYKPFDGDDAS